MRKWFSFIKIYFWLNSLSKTWHYWTKVELSMWSISFLRIQIYLGQGFPSQILKFDDVSCYLNNFHLFLKLRIKMLSLRAVSKIINRKDYRAFNSCKWLRPSLRFKVLNWAHSGYMNVCQRFKILEHELNMRKELKIPALRKLKSINLRKQKILNCW